MLRAPLSTAFRPASSLPRRRVGTASIGLAFGGLLFALAGSAGAQLLPPPAPAGNPVTPAKTNLGKVLFWDEQLSSTRTVACGTCHIMADGGADPRSLGGPLAIHPGLDGVFGGPDDVFGSPGVPVSNADGTYSFDTTFGLADQVTGRRASPAVNGGYPDDLFWDGRAGSEFVDPVSQAVILADGAALETQSLEPLTSVIEMAHTGRTVEDVLVRIGESTPLAIAAHVPSPLVEWIDGRSYGELFEEAFGDAQITAPRVAFAIATYERTLNTNQTPFDTFLATNGGLTDQERAGRSVFLSSSCDRCHSLEIMSDHEFHYTGVRPPGEDAGRFDVTGVESDRAKMRTPSLRNVDLRAPYMRNGRFETLEAVVDFYDRGGDFDAPNKDPLVRELNLTAQEKADLVAFLRRPLTDPRLRDELPPFDRPTLYTESSQVPVLEGMGVASAGGLVPRPVAIEPPISGNPSFTVAVFDIDGAALRAATELAASASAAQGTEGLPTPQALLVIDSEDPGTTTPTSGELVFRSVDLLEDGTGDYYASSSIALPADRVSIGTEWVGRWYVEGIGTGGGPAVSRAFRFGIFEPFGTGILFIGDFETGGTERWSSATP